MGLDCGNSSKKEFSSSKICRIYNIEEYKSSELCTQDISVERLAACGNTTNPRTEYFSDFAILLARGRYSSSSYTFQLPRVGKYTQSTIQHYSFHQRHTTQLKESNYTALTASSFIFLPFTIMHNTG